MKRTTTSVTEGVDLAGSLAVVTGASSGLGRECARVLAMRGAGVVLACRDPAKAERVVAELAASIGAEAAGRCEVRACDTASVASVRALAAGLVADRRPVDRLFLNAGVFGLGYRLTEDGFEYTYAANYIGHFLLVHQLLEAGAIAACGRIVGTMSEGGYLNPFSRADLEMLAAPRENARRYSRYLASPNSKVLLALMMREASRRVAGTPRSAITFTCGNPGPTLTDNINQGGAAARLFSRVFAPLLFRRVEEGAAVLLWAATSPALAGRTGALFTHALEEVVLPDKCVDPAMAERAWDATEAILGLSPWPPSLRQRRHDEHDLAR